MKRLKQEIAKRASLIFAILFGTATCLYCGLLQGCAIFDTTSTITLPDGTKYKVSTKSDGLLEWQDGTKKIVVDNRGRPGMIEQFFGAIVLRAPDVTLEK